MKNMLVNLDWRKLRTPKTALALIFISVGFLGASYYFHLLSKQIPNVPHPLQDAIRGGFISLLLVGSLAFIPDLAEMLGEGVKRAKFRKFFGSDIFTTGMEVVFQHTKANTLYTRRYSSHASRQEEWEPHDGVELDVIILPDLEAVSAVAELCGLMGVNFASGIEDGYVSGTLPSRTVVCVGLLCNVAMKKASSHSSKLFTIQPAPDATNFSIRISGSLAEYNTAKTEHGTKDFALIVRTFQEEGDKVIPLFVCGGRNEEGTKAAGLYLRRHWTDLYRQYAGKDLNLFSLALALSFTPGSPESATPLPPAFSEKK